jgi:hypothetical protein
MKPPRVEDGHPARGGEGGGPARPPRLLPWFILLLILLAAFLMDLTEPPSNAEMEYMDRGGMTAREYHDATEGGSHD